MKRAPTSNKRCRVASPAPKGDSQEIVELRRSKRVCAIHPSSLGSPGDSHILGDNAYDALQAIRALADPHTVLLKEADAHIPSDGVAVHYVRSPTFNPSMMPKRTDDAATRKMWDIVVGAIGESRFYDDAFCSLIDNLYGRTVLLVVRTRIVDAVPAEAFDMLVQIVLDTSYCLRTRSCCATLCSDISSRLIPAVGCEAGASGTGPPGTSPVLIRASVIADMLETECSHVHDIGSDSLREHLSVLGSLTQADLYRYLCVNVCGLSPEKTPAEHMRPRMTHIRIGLIIKTLNMMFTARLNFGQAGACIVLRSESVRRFVGYMLGVGVPVAFAHDIAASFVAQSAESWVMPTGTTPDNASGDEAGGMPRDPSWLASVCARLFQPPVGAFTGPLQALRVLATVVQGLVGHKRSSELVEFCTQFTTFLDIGALLDIVSSLVLAHTHDKTVSVAENALTIIRFLTSTSEELPCPVRRQAITAAFVARPHLLVRLYKHLDGPNGGTRDFWTLLFARDLLACVLRDPCIEATKAWLEHTGLLRIIFDTLVRTVCTETFGPHWSSDVRREDVILTCLHACCTLPPNLVMMDALWLRRLPLPLVTSFLCWVRSIPITAETANMRKAVLYLLLRVLVGCSMLPEAWCPSQSFGGAQNMWDAAVRCASGNNIEKLLEVMCQLSGRGAAQHPQLTYGRMLPPIIGATRTLLVRLVENYPTPSIGRMASHLLRSARIAGIDRLQLPKAARDACLLISWPKLDLRGTKLDQSNTSIAADLYAIDCAASGVRTRTSEETRVAKLQELANILFGNIACGAVPAAERPCVAFHSASQPPAGSSDKSATEDRTVLLSCGCAVCRSCILFACATHKHDKCPKCVKTHLATFALSKLYPHLMSSCT